MRGVELTSYDIQHQLSEQLYRDTGVRLRESPMTMERVKKALA